MLPKHYKLQYSKVEIAKEVSRIGLEIGTWAKNIKDQEILAIPILRGGIFFFADLVREIPVSVEVLPGKASSYELNKNAKQLDKVNISIDNEKLRNRRVLLVDDICDSGKTLKALSEHIIEHGAIEVKSAVLIHRVLEKVIFKPDWKGFDFIGNDWFVGYGMEDKNRWSNLPDIYTIIVSN